MSEVCQCALGSFCLKLRRAVMLLSEMQTYCVTTLVGSLLVLYSNHTFLCDKYTQHTEQLV